MLRFLSSIVLLYCLSPKERISWGGNVREKPSKFLNNMDESIYNTEPHVWDDEMRLMLAKTIGKRFPIDDVIVESKKRSSHIECDNSKKTRRE